MFAQVSWFLLIAINVGVGEDSYIIKLLSTWLKVASLINLDNIENKLFKKKFSGTLRIKPGTAGREEEMLPLRYAPPSGSQSCSRQESISSWSPDSEAGTNSLGQPNPSVVASHPCSFNLQLMLTIKFPQAHVVCRQIGYSQALTAHNGSFFGQVPDQVNEIIIWDQIL